MIREEIRHMTDTKPALARTLGAIPGHASPSTAAAEVH
jgi:hypothetical protein